MFSQGSKEPWIRSRDPSSSPFWSYELKQEYEHTGRQQGQVQNQEGKSYNL